MMVGLCDLFEVGFRMRSPTPRHPRWRSDDVGFPLFDLFEVSVA